MVEILEILSTRPEKSGKKVRWAKCRCSCGKIFEARLANVKAGQIKSCGHGRNKLLDHGREICREYDALGTNVISLLTGTVNKNSTTGYRGVSLTRNGKYRAYINFRNKQYHLGVYDDPISASKAYKTARKVIHGDFLEWYSHKWPEKWDKMKDKKP